MRRQVLLRKFAAEEFRQFVLGEGEAGAVPQSGAKRVSARRKIAHLLQNGAQVAVRLGEVRPEFQLRGGSRRRRRPAAPGRERQRPGCCALWRSPASVRRPAAAGDGFVQFSQVLQGDAEVVVRFDVVRPQFQRPAVTGDGFVQISLVLAGDAGVVVRLGKVRLQFHCAAIGSDCLGKLPLLLEDAAEAVVGLGEVRLQLQRPAATGGGFVQLPLAVEGDAQVVVGRGEVWLQVRRPAIASDRLGAVFPAP